MVGSFVLSAPAASIEELALLLTLPVFEYLAVHLAGRGYSPLNVWVLGSLAGVGAGRLFHRYLLAPTDLATWGIMAAVALPTLAAAILATYQRME